MTNIITNQELIKDTSSFKSGDVHQAILDVGYHMWQKMEGWGYERMLQYQEETFGTFAKFAILIGKYNHQVGNGGHIQYFDNGYASNGGSFNRWHDDSIELHQEMERLFHKCVPEHITNRREVQDIISRFKIELDTEDTVEEWDDEEQEYVDVDNENKGSVENNSLLDELDTAYYEVNEDFMTSFNDYCKTLFN